MPRYLLDLDLRATGRPPLHRIREVDATDVMQAIDRFTQAIVSPHWRAADITKLSLTVDQLTADQRP